MEIETLSTRATVITLCPVLIHRFDSLDPRDEYSVEPCGSPLQVIHTHEIVGDDYGSWPVDNFHFDCGHSFEDMRKSQRYGDQL